MDQELLIQVLTALVIPILPAIAAFVIKFISVKMDAIKAQTQQDKIDQYIDILNDTVADVVISLNQTTVDSLKAAAADNKLTEEEIEEISNKAIDAVYLILGRQGRELLQTVFDDLDALIAAKIERAVVEVKEVE